ncbi:MULTISPECIES: glycosyltransferase family 2 protein [Micromonospora]|uniref:glycosyltransferase family 2 protein n=1 Tax=Micromonospora TaxID=1873 RepID=UPI00064BAD71|nr:MULTISPECIES: glycosyltransferase family A protein [Micromonospora]MDG4750883.1 glycosyltransferase family A protein [Micromonospora sp. WMMD718]UFN96862.1 glycosyltransferase family 2 protein [Micromonospora aurantiaca]
MRDRDSTAPRLVVCICTSVRGDQTDGDLLAAPLSAVLDSIAAQTRLPDHLVVVKDGPAAGALRRAVADLPVPARVHALARGAELHDMRNLALAQHPGDHVLLVDDDGILLSTRCLELLTAALSARRPALAQLPVLRSAPLAVPAPDGGADYAWDVERGRARHGFDQVLTPGADTPVWRDVENACGAALCLTAWRPAGCRFAPLPWGTHYGMETVLAQRLKRVRGRPQIILQNPEAAVLNLKWAAPYADSRPGKVRLPCDTVGDEQVDQLSKLAVGGFEDSISRKSPIGFYADYISGMAYSFGVVSPDAGRRFLARTRQVFVADDLLRHPNVLRLDSRDERERAFVQAVERLGLPAAAGRTPQPPPNREGEEEWI